MTSTSKMQTQVLLLALIMTAAIAALLHRILLFQTPLPAEVDWRDLRVPEYSLEIVERKSSISDRIFARGSSSRLVLSTSEPSVIVYWLDLEVIHSRESAGFSVDAMTKGQRGTSLEVARVIETPHAGIDQLLIGTIDDRTAVQTCLIRNSTAAVDGEKLTQLQEAQRVRSAWETLRHILGLRENIRWECVLITLRVQSDDMNDEDLQQDFVSLIQSVKKIYDAAPQL